MDSLYLSCEVVLPLFFTLSLGYFLRRIGIFNEKFLSDLNILIFKVFYPILVFTNIYSTDSSVKVNFKLIGYAILTIVAFFLLLLFIVPIFEKENKRKGVIIQGIIRSNSLLFALPISNALFGSEYNYITSVVIGFMVTLVNVISVIVLQIFKDSEINYKKIIINISRNPLIRGIVVGFIFSSFGIKLPSVLDKTITDLSKVATPLALMTLGGFFKFKEVYKNIKPLIWVCLGKLVLMPLIFLPIAILLKFDNFSIGILAAIYCSPTATASFTMAKEVGADYELAGHIVALTSVLCTFTIFITIFILKFLSYL